MPTPELPAAMSHLEVQIEALIRRGMQDDVPTDVFKQILSIDRKFEELRMVLTAETPKKKLFNRKK
jgi:hypothetical protein